MPVRLGRFEMPKRLTKEESTATETYAKFTAEPFETGYGHTIGNSIRRVRTAAPRRRHAASGPQSSGSRSSGVPPGGGACAGSGRVPSPQTSRSSRGGRCMLDMRLKVREGPRLSESPLVANLTHYPAWGWRLLPTFADARSCVY